MSDTKPCHMIPGAVDSLAFLPNLAICAQCAPKEMGRIAIRFMVGLDSVGKVERGLTSERS